MRRPCFFGGGFYKSPYKNGGEYERINNIGVMDSNDYTRYGFVFVTFTMIIDLIICMLSFWLFSWLYNGLLDNDILQSSLMIAVIYASCLIHGGVVLHKRAVMDFNVLLIVMRNITFFAIVSYVIMTLGGFLMLPLLWSLLFYIVVAVCSLSFRLSLRYFIKKLRRTKSFVRNVVFIGASKNNMEMYEAMKNSVGGGFAAVGYFDDALNPEMPAECSYLGSPDDVIDYLKAHPMVHELYYGIVPVDKKKVLRIANYCFNHFVRCYIVPSVESSFSQRMYYNSMGNIVFISFFREPLMRVENRFLKRAFDILISFIFLVTLFPIIFVVVAIISSITMPGPIFFRQKRTGINGRDFYCWKFRSMKVNKDADNMQATKDDPRKTKWGDIMRRTNIDELPQFFNVLRGDMSLVGPRPHMLKHTEEYSALIDKYKIRHFVKPGITGWSQVTGFRGETKELAQMEGRIRGDIWYLEHWSIWLDIYIMYKTIANVIVGDKNAY